MRVVNISRLKITPHAASGDGSGDANAHGGVNGTGFSQGICRGWGDGRGKGNSDGNDYNTYDTLPINRINKYETDSDEVGEVVAR